MAWRFAARWLIPALLLGSQTLATQPEPQRLDRNGDPLPPGALHRLGKVERLRQPGSVATLALSPDGKVLASAGSTGAVCLWAVPSGKELHLLAGHAGPVHCVVFSRDGSFVASAGQDRTIRVYETATGKLFQRWYNAAGIPRALAFSPDGTLLAVGGTYTVRGLRVWVIRTGLEVDQSYYDHNPVTAVAFSPDGKAVAAAVDAGQFLLWETASGKLRGRFVTAQGKLTSLQFSPDSKTVLVAGSTGLVTAWDTTTGKQVRQFRAHEGELLGMALSADGTRLATAGRDGVRVWDPEKGAELRRYVAAEEETAVALALSADGKVLATGTAGGRLRFRGVGAVRPDATAAEQTSVLAVAVSPDGRVVATLERERIRLWDAGRGKPLRALPAEKERLRCLLYDSAGRLLAAGGLAQADGKDQGRLGVWDADSGKPLWVNFVAGGDVQHLAFTPDGKTLVALSGGRNISVRDAATGKELRSAHLELPALDLLALSPDGRALACAPARGPVQIWDVATAMKVGQVGERLDRFLALAFTPDGRTLATVAADGDVCLWELASLKERVRLTAFGRLAAVLRGSPALAFSADGRLMAVSRADLSVSAWDTALRTELAEFRGHRDAVCALAFAPDGKSLLSGSWDTTALVWDMKDRRKGKLLQDPLSEAAVERAWSALGLADPAAAHASLWSLVESPRQAVAHFAKHLRPEPARGRTAEQMIVELNSPRYPLRQKATEELARLGEQARPALVKALAGKPTLETKRRIEGLLTRLGRAQPHPDDLRSLRALEVLERIATPEARQLVETLARGEGEGLLTIEARATLARISRRAAAGR
jgi:WD40 repeat protein